MNVLTIIGRKGGNQGHLARLLGTVLSGLGCFVLVDDAGTTTPYPPSRRQPCNQVPSKRVTVIRTAVR